MNRTVLIAILCGHLGAFAFGFFANASFQANRLGEDITLPLAIAFVGMSAAIISSFALYSIWKWKEIRRHELATGVYMSALLIFSFFIGRLLEGRV